MKRFFALSIILIFAFSCTKNSPSEPTPLPLQTPEMVDLGLSVKWASFNLGATKPEEYGRFFAWADVTGQTWNGSSWSGGGFGTILPYMVDTNGNLKSEYDAAYVLLGNNWRMPTKAEQEELIYNCKREWTTNYNGTGVAGSVFTSKKTGYTNKSIFLPAAGSGGRDGLYYAGTTGHYWSSTVATLNNSWYLVFYTSNNVNMEMNVRNNGLPIRPVAK